MTHRDESLKQSSIFICCWSPQLDSGCCPNPNWIWEEDSCNRASSPFCPNLKTIFIRGPDHMEWFRLILWSCFTGYENVCPTAYLAAEFVYATPLKPLSERSGIVILYYASFLIPRISLTPSALHWYHLLFIHKYLKMYYYFRILLVNIFSMHYH